MAAVMKATSSARRKVAAASDVKIISYYLNNLKKLTHRRISLECLRCGFTVGVFTVAYRENKHTQKSVCAALRKLRFYGYLQDGLKLN